MKRNDVDFCHVEVYHFAIHDRLLEWGRAQNNHREAKTSPMFAGFESTAKAKSQMATPLPPVNVQAVQQTNDHIKAMGERHRKAVHWHYSLNKSPGFGMRYIGCTKAELMSIVVDARQILTMSLRKAGIVV